MRAFAGRNWLGRLWAGRLFRGTAGTVVVPPSRVLTLAGRASGRVVLTGCTSNVVVLGGQ